MLEIIALVFDGQALRPADPAAAETLSRLPIGVRLNAKKITKATARGDDWRDGANRLYWAGLAHLVENSDLVSVRDAHESILKGLGFTRRAYFQRPLGRGIGWTEEVVSISRDSMDDEEFGLLFERARAIMVEKTGRDPWDEWVAKKEADEKKGKR